MQMALSTVGSDVFKQPITIVGAIGVLLLMDWKFTVVTLILFRCVCCRFAFTANVLERQCKTSRKAWPKWS